MIDLTGTISQVNVGISIPRKTCLNYIKNLLNNKVMEAPEKIYLNQDDGLIWHCRSYKDDIEYIRKNAFIKKACEWIETNMDDYIHVEYDTVTGMPTNEAHIAHKKVVEDFKKYMEDKI